MKNDNITNWDDCTTGDDVYYTSSTTEVSSGSITFSGSGIMTLSGGGDDKIDEIDKRLKVIEKIFLNIDEEDMAYLLIKYM